MFALVDGFCCLSFFLLYPFFASLLFERDVLLLLLRSSVGVVLFLFVCVCVPEHDISGLKVQRLGT